MTQFVSQGFVLIGDHEVMSPVSPAAFVKQHGRAEISDDRKEQGSHATHGQRLSKSAEATGRPTLTFSF
jgi:hypothetical protein